MPNKTEVSKTHKVKKWWPHLVLKLTVVMIFLTIFMGFMANTFPVPDKAPNEIPFPDFGENIPGPEWLFLLFWQPFWYLKGILKKYLFITSVIPIGLFVFLVFLPYFHKIPYKRIPGLKKLLTMARNMTSGIFKSFIYAIPALVFALGLGLGIYKSGHQAKVLGCDSCHNPAMGHQMAIPPMNVFEYYNVRRAMQVAVGKYRAGKSSGVNAEGEQVYDTGGEAESYKDANWQMRHMYEPTFTW